MTKWMRITRREFEQLGGHDNPNLRQEADRTGRRRFMMRVWEHAPRTALPPEIGE